MKIAIADNNSGKFTQDLQDYWIKEGHEVKFERGASEHLAQWADLYWVDTWDNNIHYLWKLYNDDPDGNRTKDWDNNKKPIVVCRLLDWEVWVGLARDQRMIDWVDKAIAIAPHIEKKLRAENNWHDLKVIRPGVNTSKFPLKKTRTDGFQIGMVLGDMWWPKNHMAGLDIFTTISRHDPRWRLHIRGQHEPGEYWPQMYKHYLESREIEDKVTLYPQLADLNEWYENIDILLHPGMKEAFCYAVGEALAKGIHVVCNEFYGSRDIWPEWILYQTHEEAVSIVESPAILKPKDYRQYILDNYTVEKMMKGINEYLGI